MNQNVQWEYSQALWDVGPYLQNTLCIMLKNYFLVQQQEEDKS